MTKHQGSDTVAHGIFVGTFVWYGFDMRMSSFTLRLGKELALVKQLSF